MITTSRLLRSFLHFAGFAAIVKHHSWKVAALTSSGIKKATASATTTVDGVPVHAVPLFRNREDSPYCFVASTPPLDRPQINFLATQVWPAARTAAVCLFQYMTVEDAPGIQTVCELGCGPGLPSLTAAAVTASKECHVRRVVATDIDAFALQLVRQAAVDQGFSDILHTQQFDLTSENASSLPVADLYVLSDVFESAAVAQGAARVTQHVLTHYPNASVWVFCQADRAQRDVYLSEMRRIMDDPKLHWSQPQKEQKPTNQRLWLCEVDETTVPYG